MICSGLDIRYLLEKKAFNHSYMARELNITPQVIFLVTRGVKKSQRVTIYIEMFLNIAPGKLELSNERRNTLVEVV